MAPASTTYHVICAVMTLSTIIARCGRTCAFQAGRCSRKNIRSYSVIPTSSFRSQRQLTSRLGVSVYDNEETIGSLPYSTTSSKEVKPKAQTASSTLPFSSPRNAFDDSLPSSYKGSSGVSEWAKLGLLTDLVDALTSPNIGLTEGPTPVQTMAIPEILRGCKDRMASAESVNKPKREEGKSSFDVDVSGGGAKVEVEMGIPPVKSVAFAAATGKFSFRASSLLILVTEVVLQWRRSC